MDSTSACYWKFPLSWILILSIILIISTTGPQVKSGQTFCLYLHPFSFPIVLFVVQKVYHIYQFSKWWFEHYFCLLLLDLSVLDYFVVHIVVCIYLWSWIKSWASLLPVSLPILQSYGILWCLISTNAAKWWFVQHFCLLLQVFSIIDYFCVQNVGSVYHCS